MPFATVEGTTIHYVDAGHGDPPLLLLHAFPFHSEQWAPQVACASATRRVIVPDLKGFGLSAAPDDRREYTMERYAGEVAGLLDQLGIDQVVVAGLSMGGYIAFEFLRHYRPRVAGLVLADTRAAADTPEVIDRRTKQQEQVESGSLSAVVDTLLEGLLCAETKHNRPQLVEHVRTMMLANPPAGFIGALEAMKLRPDSTPDLTGIDLPTLFIAGDEDALSPPPVAHAMHDQVRNSHLAVLAHAGHLSNLEAPDGFNDALTDFLEP